MCNINKLTKHHDVDTLSRKAWPLGPGRANEKVNKINKEILKNMAAQTFLSTTPNFPWVQIEPGHLYVNAVTMVIAVTAMEYSHDQPRVT